jgi:7-cyano-7-deazaguanine synthase
MARRDGYSARALTIEIHGTADAELRAARLLGKRVGVLEHRFVRMPDVREAGDIAGSKALAKKAIPATYIPMKNALYYSMAAAYAEEKGADCVIGGQNADDKRVFEDTSEEFFASLQKTITASSPRLRGRGFKVLRPLKDKTKPQVVALAVGMGVPLELTWSCYRSGEEHCWRCDGCRRRVEAFQTAGVVDPLRR